MLKALYVKNYVLIDSLDVEFPAGLSIITGQTGAGKSIILGALSLVLGAKADSSMVGSSADNCVVEALFHVKGDKRLRASMEAAGLDYNDGQIVIRRVLSKSGRSRSFVNDEPASVSLLSSLSPLLIDIHSQHQTMMLKDSAFQLSILDYYAGNLSLLEKCAEAFRQQASLESEIKELSGKMRRLAMEKDYYQAQFDQLEAARLRDGELEELEEEQKVLANAEEIKSDLYAVKGIFEGEETSLDAGLKEAVKLLSKLASFKGGASELSSRIESARLDLSDVYDEICDMESSVDVSPERLTEVEDRMSLIYSLLKKHSCANVAELLAVRESLSNMLFDASALTERKQALEKDLEVAKKEFSSVCAALHKARTEASRGFSQEIQKDIRSLELEKAVFTAEIIPSAPSSTGSDSVSFRFSATGGAPADVAKCASGGEMSRIMLCLKALMARFANMPSMIFDEIDTGVSGSVADKMGSMICSMGGHMQVFAITHLPQVAAKGNAHYLVSKENSEEGTARTVIRRISGEDRVMEIARMLSGSSISLAAIANAETLLSASLISH